MRLTAIVLTFAVLLLSLPSGISAQETPPGTSCRAETDLLVVSAAAQQRVPSLFEVEVTVRNSAVGQIRLDPAEVILIPDRGGVAKPLTLRQAQEAISSPVSVGVYVFVTFGAFGLFIGAGRQALLLNDVERRILRPATVPPGAALTGSLYFRPDPGLTRFVLVLDSLAKASGEPLPAVRLPGCLVPGRQPAASTSPTQARAFTPNARAVAGPLTATVSTVVLTQDGAVLWLTLENSAAWEARLFNATADATLTDGAGRNYRVRVLRSDLPDRVPTAGTVRGRLVFDPLPPTAAVPLLLTLPGIEVGDASYDIKVTLHF